MKKLNGGRESPFKQTMIIPDSEPKKIALIMSGGGLSKKSLQLQQQVLESQIKLYGLIEEIRSEQLEKDELGRDNTKLCELNGKINQNNEYIDGKYQSKIQQDRLKKQTAIRPGIGGDAKKTAEQIEADEERKRRREEGWNGRSIPKGVEALKPYNALIDPNCTYMELKKVHSTLEQTMGEKINDAERKILKMRAKLRKQRLELINEEKPTEGKILEKNMIAFEATMNGELPASIENKSSPFYERNIRNVHLLGFGIVPPSKPPKRQPRIISFSPDEEERMKQKTLENTMRTKTASSQGTWPWVSPGRKSRQRGISQDGEQKRKIPSSGYYNYSNEFGDEQLQRNLDYYQGNQQQYNNDLMYDKQFDNTGPEYNRSQQVLNSRNRNRDE
ncbi:MAG: hypothetical protein EZS28_000945 [Streblomastix strix]|uniref:Uncharacterized protein n=1 Tax=Streblomastix strix TaxID=222440 RepID=A0A5J4X9Q0_9EUKA|nr:MAG: hypothetical protein EZS28_000945 [Streblomastix strix]